MTSKISFSRLLKEDIKKRAWLAALSAVIFIVIIPILTFIQLEGRMASYNASLSLEELELVKEWFSIKLLFESYGMSWGVMFGAVAAGMTGFSYLHSKSQTDFYHSLPVKRETWFAVTYISSFIQIIVPYLIGYALLVVMGCVKHVIWPKVFIQLPIVVGITILIFLLIYSMTILAVILTGKIVVAILGAAVFLFGGAVLGALKLYIMVQSFETYVGTVRYGMSGNILFGETNWLSPIMAYWNIISKYRGKGNLIKPMIIIGICIILISLLALLLYRIRPSESAGKAIAFPKLEAVIKIVLAISAGIFFGVIVGSQNQTQGMKTEWLFGIGILAAILACAIIEFIYHMDMRLIFKKKISLGIAVLGTMTILAAVHYDWFGYDSYFPKEEKLEAMAVDASSLTRWEWMTAKCYKDQNYDDRMKELQLEDFAQLYELARTGVEAVGSEHYNNREETYITIAYYLKNGRTVYRGYYVKQEDAMKCMEKLLEDNNYREKVFSFDCLDVDQIKKCDYINYRHEATVLQLTKEQQHNLIETYKQEMLSRPMITFASGNVIGELEILLGEEEYYYNAVLYKELEGTIALLEEYGYPVPDKITLDEVKKMTVQDLRTPEEMSEDGVMPDKEETDTIITDPVEMQEILERILYEQNQYSEPNLYVEIEFTDGLMDTFSLRKK